MVGLAPHTKWRRVGGVTLLCGEPDTACDDVAALAPESQA
jgi:hypothetical protein